MLQPKDFNNSYKQPTVLVAPLGWGLGHATRCIPIIKELLLLNCKVLIAGDSAVTALLKKEFPEQTFLPLIDYNIRYSKNSFWLPVKMLLQVPHIIKSIYIENKWLKDTVRKYNIDVVISDNRFGLYHSTITTIYITHQLLIKTGTSFTETLAQKIHYYFIKKYTKCWVPDFLGEYNLAGQLSHPLHKPANIEYIGGLSRFEKQTGIEKKYDLLIIISGPEPQRALFEKLLIEQLKNYNGKVLFVRGLPVNDTPVAAFNGVTFVNHLSSAELSTAIQQSNIVISRAGYTTVMDMLKLEQKAILVPTPGQTEQIYLAENLHQKKIFFCLRQDEFILDKVLLQAESFPFNKENFNMDLYKEAVKKLIDQL